MKTKAFKLVLLTVLYGIVILNFISCKTPISIALDGWWSIDTIYYKNFDIKNCLNSNAIFFYKETMELPTTSNRCEGIYGKSDIGTWEIIETDSIPILIKIESENKIFSGTHQVIFYKDEKNKLLKFILVSNDFYLIGRKGLFNYETNIETINELIEMSN